MEPSYKVAFKICPLFSRAAPETGRSLSFCLFRDYTWRTPMYWDVRALDSMPITYSSGYQEGGRS